MSDMEHDMNLMDLMERFSTPDKARTHLEAILWPDGPVCPKCGDTGHAYALKPKEGAKTHARKGVYKCAECRRQFTVTVGTIFEGSHIPLHKWLIAVHLMCASKKGISSHQLHRMLGMKYQSAWFMTHRIRYAMKQAPLLEKLTGTIEVDETYVGGKEHGVGRGNYRTEQSNKVPVVSLVQRDGIARSFAMERVTFNNISPILRDNIHQLAHLNTDDAKVYARIHPWFPHHRSVNHSAREYSRKEPSRTVHTNTVEGFFSLIKRGVYGTYHHWSKQHLHRYLSEFDFRYNHRGVEDGARAIAAIRLAEGKRLTYKPLTKGA